jgi:hypothetical protein
MNSMLMTTMGKGGVEKQGVKKQSQATSAMGVVTTASDGCRTSSSLADKRTIQAELIGINVEDIESSKLVSDVAVDDSELKSIASDGYGKPHSVATKTLVQFAVVVRLCLSRKSNATELFLTHYVTPIYIKETKHGGLGG